MQRSMIQFSTAICLLLTCAGLSGCASALFGAGTAAIVASTTEKGLSTSLSDTQIMAKIKDRFMQTNFSLLANVEVSVNDGSVLMTGKVKTPDHKVQATRTAWEIRGVREVINELQITDTTSIKDVAKDLAASAAMRGKMIADDKISSLNFSVDVVNGIMYLSGVAKDADEMNRVISHAQEVRFTQRVVNYIILQDDKRY
jgi:osmotically-inducible protein OsmY